MAPIGGVRAAYLSAGKDAIPDSVASRPNDDSAFNNADSDGLTLNFASDFNQFAVRISANTLNHTRLRVYDYEANSGSGAYVHSQDVSATVAGDAVVVDFAVSAGTDYGVELDAEGATFDHGFNSTQGGYPYTSTDVDIVSRSTNGAQDASGGLSEPTCINDVGNPDNVL